MLSTKNEIEIAVRLYENKFYGTTYGKGLYRKAIYNGSIDLQQPTVKYVIDLFSFDDWSNQAKTDEQMDYVRKTGSFRDKLFSWIYRYDKDKKTKTLADGFCAMDMNSNEIIVVIIDKDVNIQNEWEVTAKPCKQAMNGHKAPTLLATNADLSEWKNEVDPDFGTVS